ncbi:hypothetical protein HDU97_003385 [Phlyctochytrium planicorne]|nr:hypothetical protein HDU97_003385 [Phlyctochytrium planicorne]
MLAENAPRVSRLPADIVEKLERMVQRSIASSPAPLDSNPTQGEARTTRVGFMPEPNPIVPDEQDKAMMRNHVKGNRVRTATGSSLYNFEQGSEHPGVARDVEAGMLPPPVPEGEKKGLRTGRITGILKMKKRPPLYPTGGGNSLFSFGRPSHSSGQQSLPSEEHEGRSLPPLQPPTKIKRSITFDQSLSESAEESVDRKEAIKSAANNSKYIKRKDLTTTSQVNTKIEPSEEDEVEVFEDASTFLGAVTETTPETIAVPPASHRPKTRSRRPTLPNDFGRPQMQINTKENSAKDYSFAGGMFEDGSGGSSDEEKERDLEKNSVGEVTVKQPKTRFRSVLSGASRIGMGLFKGIEYLGDKLAYTLGYTQSRYELYLDDAEEYQKQLKQEQAERNAEELRSALSYKSDFEAGDIFLDAESGNLDAKPAAVPMQRVELRGSVVPVVANMGALAASAEPNVSNDPDAIVVQIPDAAASPPRYSDASRLV